MPIMLAKVAVVCAAVLGAVSGRRLRRDVPLGQCFGCEVNCINDCVQKYDAEVIKPDAFLQMDKPSSPKMEKKIAQDYVHRMLQAEGKQGCVKETGCNLAAQCAKSVENQMIAEAKQEREQHADHELDFAHDTVSKDHKKWTDVSAQEVTIADLPSFHAATDAAENKRAHSQHGAASQADLDKLDSFHSSAKLHLAQTALAPVPDQTSYYPLHPVKIGVFSNGQQSLTQCMRYCFATTCGCEDSGLTGGAGGTGTMQKLAKAGADSGFHTDTSPQWRYKKATKDQCGKGVGKLIKGLYIIYYAGPGGTFEVCSDKMFKAKAGTSGALGLTDPLEDQYKCDCGINRLDCNEPDFGCSWDETSDRCEFKAMHNTVCYHRYKTDVTL